MEKCDLKKNILITGSNGFIGSTLKNILKYNIIEVSRDNGYDILNLSSLLEIDLDIDTVIHLAAKTFVPDSFENPYDFYKFNIDSTINIAEFCKIKKVKKLIYFNTYMYGSPNYLPIDENHQLKFQSPYHRSKYISEEILLNYFKQIETKVVSLRLFNVYGRNQSNNFLIPTIINKLSKDILELNDLSPKRDYIYIKDICSLVNKIIRLPEYQLITDFYNVGYGKSYSVKEIVEYIIKIKRKKIKVIDKNIQRENEVMDCFANINKVKSTFNWNPRYSLQKGLEDMIK
ncbi:NAD-dependent epimerase/dehydratase family protein [Aliarcobacter cryaerophilus]|uniref:NAD-dependent epimerase/dehydratase family protein n=1 Tax=Aliarcobacter cryaerophilus TaxID=28198 RepID=UPI0021B4BFEE|nr:NAD(P)-dependent oxidoreductase [Aliarcobacter cryaerophilus]MCT7468652.1 NAD(P)-dependent oxidoreductase [Aliarcobacter cryaerophilus]